MGAWTGFIWIRIGKSDVLCDNDHEYTVSIQCGEFPDYMLKH